MWCLGAKCHLVNGLYIQTSLAVNCLPATSDCYMRKNDGLENYLKKKKKNFFFFFGIFTSGRFCLTPGSAGVRLHFREAPGWSGRVHMYAWILTQMFGSGSTNGTPEKDSNLWLLKHKNTEHTVNFLNIWTPKKFVVITLKFELFGSTIA